jgi:hypothetical protein
MEAMLTMADSPVTAGMNLMLDWRPSTPSAVFDW